MERVVLDKSQFWRCHENLENLIFSFYHLEGVKNKIIGFFIKYCSTIKTLSSENLMERVKQVLSEKFGFLYQRMAIIMVLFDIHGRSGFQCKEQILLFFMEWRFKTMKLRLRPEYNSS